MNHDITWYKVLRADHTAPYSGFKYPVPEHGQPGAWLPSLGELRMCSVGYHVCTEDTLPVWAYAGTVIYEVQVHGQGLVEGSKACFETIRLLERIGEVSNFNFKTGASLLKQARANEKLRLEKEAAAKALLEAEKAKRAKQRQKKRKATPAKRKK